MEIIRGKPIARGVTELMYVGDSGELEDALGVSKGVELFAAVGAGLLAFQSKGAMRLASGVAAVALALRAISRSVG